MRITATSQLMPNHVAGAPLVDQKSVAVVYADDGAPMLFTLDRTATLTLTVPSDTTGTGWAPVDLGSQLKGLQGVPGDPRVQAFAVSQDATGTIWLVVAVADDSGSGSSAVFLSDGLPNRYTAGAWHALGGHLSARRLPAHTRVSQATVGGIGGDRPLAVLAVGDGAGLQRLLLNPNPVAGEWESTPLPHATDRANCRAAVVGVNARLGPGVYAVDTLGALSTVTFTTLPKTVAGRPVVQTVELAVPAGFEPRSLATVPLADGTTELFVGGEGVRRWSPAAQTHSNQPGDLVVPAGKAGGVTGVTAVADHKGQVTVWAQDSRDVLVQTTGTRTGDTVAWGPALWVASEVTAAAAYRVPAGLGTSTTGLLIAATGGELSLLVQDPQNNLWQRRTVAVPRSDQVSTLTTFTTRIVVTDDEGVPAPGCVVEISSDSDQAALVNGAYYALRPSVAKPVLADAGGVVTIVLETDDLAAPVYTLTAWSPDAPDAVAREVEDPGAQAKRLLDAVEHGDDVTNAVRCDGAKVFPNGLDKGTAGVVADAVKGSMKVHAALLRGHAPGDGTGTLFAMRYHDGKATPLEAHEVAMLRDDPDHDVIQVHAGDLLRAMFGESTLAIWLDEAFNFAVKIGKLWYGFVIGVVDQALAVVDWMLRKVLGLSLEDLTAWLGFIFSWSDIRRNHTVVAKIVEHSFDMLAETLRETKSSVSAVAADMRRMLAADDGKLDPGTDPALEQRARAVSADREPDRPEQQWGAQQLSANLGGTEMGPMALPAVDDLWAHLATVELTVIQDAYERLYQQLLDGYQEMSYADVARVVLDVVGTVVVDAAEAALLTAIEAAALMGTVLKELLTIHWKIPVLTEIYEKVICENDGSLLTLLDLMSLLVAIPATISTKLVTGHNLFSDAQIEAVKAARDWPGIVSALTTAAPALRASRHERRELGDVDPAVMAAAGLEMVAVWARAVSLNTFVLREIAETPKVGELANLAKIAFDYLAWAVSSISMIIIAANSGSSNERATLDRMVTVLSVLSPMRDTYLVAYRARNARSSPYSDATRYVETAYGFVLVFYTIRSLVMQSGETRPTGVEQPVWAALLAMKFIQGFSSSLYYSLGFTQTESWKDPSMKALLKYAFYTRAGILTVRLAANLVRASMQLHYRIADYDGPM